ncbi:MAG: hypothetical protein BECKG1743D_GA0114223_112492 [Candidatus Kentron sp. G]|nr:MAG: hypothetical protein BECKG1743D_GA0114223_112492 [Candidatus Kentron sp. G]
MDSHPSSSDSQPAEYAAKTKTMTMTDKSTSKPFDFEKFRDEVQARLKKIGNPRLSVAFAARMALAAMPMLADSAEEKGFLWYWKEEDREKHLLAVCRAAQIAGQPNEGIFSLTFCKP